MSEKEKVVIADVEKNDVATMIRKKLAEFGLPRIIIILFLITLIVTAHFAGMNVPSFLGDMFTRWGAWGILVLAMVPAIQSGIGPNFGVPIGIVGGLLGAVLSLEMRYRGLFDFVTNETLFALTGLGVALVLGVIFGSFMGVLYGLLLNKVKGSEMAISVYVGFSGVALFNIVWATIPVSSSVMILPGRGEGLRQMINLQDDFERVLDNMLRFNIGAMTIRGGLLITFFIMCVLMYIFTRSRLGMKMSSAGANPSYARASGINVDKMRILGTTISTALGSFGIVIYAQSFGFLQMYGAPLMMGFTAVASVLIGGASVRRARVFDVLLGAFLFNAILVIALPLSTTLIPDSPGIPEMVRLIISNGIILYALTRAKGGR